MPKTNPFDHYTDEYEQWFEENPLLFFSELDALKKVIPEKQKGVEIGVGSGFFASKLGISEGVEPSESMRKKAIDRGIRAVCGVAEKLPYASESIDFVLMITVICFVDDPDLSFQEAYRVLNDKGSFIIAFIDKESPLGRMYEKNKQQSVFYKEAAFYNTSQVLDGLKQNGFEPAKIYQTLYGDLTKITKPQKPIEGYGQGSFVVIKANKKVKNEN
ncbi:MAG: class I SAM-dependent methyltransferase [Bacteroidales bacterium]|jgi:SAM-dependent methyltransferase|nr:class I SAM-dependent methyltransferase [Bacteroidales bacterium]